MATQCYVVSYETGGETRFEALPEECTLVQAKHRASALVKESDGGNAKVYVQGRGKPRLVAERRFALRNWNWHDIKR